MLLRMTEDSRLLDLHLQQLVFDSLKKILVDCTVALVASIQAAPAVVQSSDRCSIVYVLFIRR